MLHLFSKPVKKTVLVYCLSRGAPFSDYALAPFRLTSLSKFALSVRLKKELSITAYAIVLVIRPRHPFENYSPRCPNQYFHKSMAGSFFKSLMPKELITGNTPVSLIAALRNKQILKSYDLICVSCVPNKCRHISMYLLGT